MEDNENIFSTIQQRYDALSKTQRRIAGYLLQHPNTGCFLTLKQLSKETHTTEATILSFSKNIGCDSFADMRNKMQRYISQWMFPSARLKNTLLSENEPGSISAAVINSEFNALKQSYDRISDGDIDRVLTLLHGARRVYVLASDYTTAVSNVFVERFSRLGLDVRNVGGLEISPTLFHLAQLREDDLLVLFSYPPLHPHTHRPGGAPAHRQTHPNPLLLRQPHLPRGQVRRHGLGQRELQPHLFQLHHRAHLAHQPPGLRLRLHLCGGVLRL